MSTDHENNDKKKARELTEHYDGIVEHDHPLPRWWIAIFVFTIIYAAIYFGYYELFGGPSSTEELNADLAVIAQMQSAVVTSEISDLEGLILKEDNIQLGKVVYDSKCFMCHGDRGQGLVGPDLTDDFWIHGHKPQQILLVIQNGVPEKGMVPWKDILTAEEQVATVAYIKSLHGTKPGGSKGPEGTEHKE